MAPNCGGECETPALGCTHESQIRHRAQRNESRARASNYCAKSTSKNFSYAPRSFISFLINLEVVGSNVAISTLLARSCQCNYCDVYCRMMGRRCVKCRNIAPKEKEERAPNKNKTPDETRMKSTAYYERRGSTHGAREQTKTQETLHAEKAHYSSRFGSSVQRILMSFHQKILCISLPRQSIRRARALAHFSPTQLESIKSEAL